MNPTTPPAPVTGEAATQASNNDGQQVPGRLPEAGCDRPAAQQHRAAALITMVTASRAAHPRKPRWELRTISARRYLTELTRHPPAHIRCLILRTGILVQPGQCGTGRP